MKHQAYILENTKEVLVFLKSRFPLFHLSNFFFRDVQFGVQAFLDRKGMKVGYTAAEAIARAFIEKLEHEKLFLPIDRQSWTVNIPEFKKPVVKATPAAPPKPAAPAARPAAVPAPVSAPAAPAPAGTPGGQTAQ
jgi:GR25 family glycosyltransferase involved in LPS biosynthesis